MISADTAALLSRFLIAQLDDLADGVGRRIDDGVPEYRLIVDPGLVAVRARRIRAALRSVAHDLLGREGRIADVTAEAVAEARTAAQAGIDLSLLIRTHRVAQSAIWDVMIDVTTRMVPDPAEQLAVQQWLSRVLHAWSDDIVVAVVDAYQAELHRFFYESRDRVLRAELREFIAGRTSELPSSRFPVGGVHVAAVCWGVDTADTVRSVAATLDARHALSVEGTSGARLAWFAVSPAVDYEVFVSRLVPAVGSHVALGPVAHGEGGFRTGHRAAWRAYGIGRWSGAAVTAYPDVALESLFTADLRAARDFVDQQLGKLDPQDARTEILCTTLQAYFASGCNAVAAATALDVHERTVSYRLKSIEERLGRTVVEGAEDLMVALRLRRLLQSAPG